MDSLPRGIFSFTLPLNITHLYVPPHTPPEEGQEEGEGPSVAALHLNYRARTAPPHSCAARSALRLGQQHCRIRYFGGGGATTTGALTRRSDGLADESNLPRLTATQLPHLPRCASVLTRLLPLRCIISHRDLVGFTSFLRLALYCC